MLANIAKRLFHDASPYPGRALENHNIRIGLFTLKLARDAGLTVHEDLLWCGCYLHDYGLLANSRNTGIAALDTEPLYLKRSWLAISHLVPDWDLSMAAANQLRDILLYNHGLLPLRRIDPLAELVRKAVQIEHSRGVITHGLPRRWCKGIFRDHPRLNLTDILVDFARITVLEDGPGQLLPIFFPAGRIAHP